MWHNSDSRFLVSFMAHGVARDRVLGRTAVGSMSCVPWAWPCRLGEVCPRWRSLQEKSQARGLAFKSVVAGSLLPNYSLLGPISTAAGCCGSLRSFRNPVSHHPISTLALIPHPQQRRVTGVDEIDDAHICLGGVLAV